PGNAPHDRRLPRRVVRSRISGGGPMSNLAGVGTYLPGWESSGRRVIGSDEDAVTIAVAAGRALLTGLREDRGRAADIDIARVVLVSRDLPLLEGGNSAAILAGL